VILYHATPGSNDPSIRKWGLLTARSQGKMRVVWLHTADRSAWAVLHTLRRHGGKAEDVIVYECDVPECGLRRFQDGLYYFLDNVHPSEIGRAITFEELSRSPVE
jgi:hypothetical protein